MLPTWLTTTCRMYRAVVIGLLLYAAFVALVAYGAPLRAWGYDSAIAWAHGLATFSALISSVVGLLLVVAIGRSGYEPPEMLTRWLTVSVGIAVLTFVLIPARNVP